MQTARHRLFVKDDIIVLTFYVFTSWVQLVSRNIYLRFILFYFYKIKRDIILYISYSQILTQKSSCHYKPHAYACVV